MTSRRSSTAALLLGVLGVVAVAALLGAWGIGFGLPFDFRPDEELFTGRAVQMALQHSLDPHFYVYPPFGLYLFALAELTLGVVAPGHLGPATAVDPTWEYLAVRIFSVLSFAAAAGLLAMIARSAYGGLAGLIAGAAFAVAPLAVQNAHFGRLDIVGIALMVLAMWLGGRAQSRAGWAAAGIAAGLAAGTKYTFGVVALYLFVLAVQGEDRLPRLAALAGGSLLAFLAVLAPVGQPLQLLDGFRFLAGRSAEGYGDLPIGFLYHPAVSLPAGLGPGGYALGLAGVVVAAWKRSRTDLALLAFLAGSYLVVGFSHEVFIRYALPMLIALCLLAGGAVQAAAGRQPQASAIALLAAALLAPSAITSVQGDRLLSATDTRQLAAGWLLANAPAGSDVLVPNYWGELFYDREAIRSRPLHPLYLTGDPLPDSFQLGRYGNRFAINRPGSGSICYQVYESGPPWQSPPPSVPAGEKVVASFRPYSE
ncbi:MAG: glycosyltransferase family 39 protein, partial [Candidatus Dormibacteraeota bacterium]|nr:glycosyltransferase family 39 protein [Candidatus Dormibacteraeota bacterium]